MDPCATADLYTPWPVPIGTVESKITTPTSGRDGPVRLLGPRELEACATSPEKLIAAMQRAVDAAGLAWPPSREWSGV